MLKKDYEGLHQICHYYARVTAIIEKILYMLKNAFILE